jgi:hypothetical protein
MKLYKWISLFTEIFKEIQKGVSPDFRILTYQAFAKIPFDSLCTATAIMKSLGQSEH